jgi:hypothetical protein
MSFQTLVLNNVEVLGYVHQNNFLGEKSFSLNSTKTLSIRGYVLDLLNSNGVKKVFNDSEQIKKLFQNFNRIVLNGVDYGTGKTLSLSFESGNWVKTTQFNAEIEILSNASYPIFNDFGNYDPNFLSSDNKLKTLYDDEKFKLIKNLSESFDIKNATNDKTIEGTQNIEIELDSSATTEDKEYLLSLAYQLADALFDTIPTQISKILSNNILRENSKFLGTESFDTINGIYRFSRNFSYKAVGDQNSLYSVEKRFSISLDKEGLVTVSENGKIKLESNYIVTNNGGKSFQNSTVVLSNAFREVTSSSPGRCTNLFSTYLPTFNLTNPYPLKLDPISRNSVLNKTDDTLEYTITFNNDRRQLNSYYWEFSLEISQDINKNTWTVSENGRVQSINQSINIVKYFAALNTWNNTVKNSIFNRIGPLYNNRTGKNSNLLKRISSSFEKSEYQGYINYNQVYTDDSSINMNSEIRQISEEIRDDGHINLPPIFKEYIVPNSNYTIVQNRNLKRLGTASVKIGYTISEVNVPQNIFNSRSYLTSITQRLVTVLNSYGINSNNRYLESVSFSSDEIEQNLSLDCAFKYVK